jgi:P-type conjugative transfer protein TrbJ
MKFRKSIVLALLCLCLTSSDSFVVPAHAGGVGVFASEFTQLLNNIQLVQQSITQAQQLANQFLQLQNMIQNTVNHPSQIFSTISGDLNDLANVVNTGNGLAYGMANLADQFTATYPGYSSNPSTNYAQQYQTWSKSTLSTFQNTLRAVGLHASQLNNEQTVLSALKQMSQSDTGAMQAVQTGNQIAVEEVAQLQKLRALMLADMQSKQSYFAAETQKDISSDDALNRALKPVNVVGTDKTY